MTKAVCLVILHVWLGSRVIHSGNERVTSNVKCESWEWPQMLAKMHGFSVRNEVYQEIPEMSFWKLQWTKVGMQSTPTSSAVPSSWPWACAPRLRWPRRRRARRGSSEAHTLLQNIASGTPSVLSWSGCRSKLADKIVWFKMWKGLFNLWKYRI